MRIYVGGISSVMNNHELRALFAQVGVVTRAFVVETDSGNGWNQGFGFVEMPDAAEAKAAIRRFSGQTFDGHALVVSEALPRESVRPWYGGSAYRDGR